MIQSFPHRLGVGRGPLHKGFVGAATGLKGTGLTAFLPPCNSTRTQNLVGSYVSNKKEFLNLSADHV